MAARDDFYRNQKVLDVVFSLSSVAMLASLIWMFWVDYDREFKTVQRKGREIEVSLLRQEVSHLQNANAKQIEEARNKVKVKFEALQPGSTEGFTDNNFEEKAKQLLLTVANDQIRAWQKSLNELKPLLQKKADALSSKKAVRDSMVSFRDILLHANAAADAIHFEEERIDAFVASVLNPLSDEVALLSKQKAELEKNIQDARAEASQAVAELDRLTREKDRLTRLADQRTYGAGAAFRNMPIVDAFAPPFKVQQLIPDGLTIDYNFKQVQRLDRCSSCHMFIDKADYTKDKLRTLVDFLNKHKNEPPESEEERAIYDSLPDALKRRHLTAADIATYCGHPRQNLFVGSNSPHPAEKFGCTVCHGGQGGSATFKFAYHFPDTAKTNGKDLETYQDKKHRWEHEYKWSESLHPDFMWDYPQLPNRFVESSCLKCHHQVFDLVRTDGHEEAPKLLEGYRLVRELGCFGCHEIAGFKSGRSVGPDLRLEPYPPLDDLTPSERAKLTADPTDPPGQLRKVGPGLRRLAEKLNRDWIARWIRNPAAFRPETRMPSYYGLHNNNPHQLADGLAGPSNLFDRYKGFPDAEIQAMTYYLLKASESYLSQLHQVHSMTPSEWMLLEDVRKAYVTIERQRQDNPNLIPRLQDPNLPPDMPVQELVRLTPEQRSKVSKDQLRAVLDYLRDLERMHRSVDALQNQPWPAPELSNHKPDPKNGEKLFQNKGCLACHGHETVRDQYKNDETLGELLTQTHFGPNLIGLREKLGYDKNKQQAEAWLYAWLTNPSNYHSRTLMPNPQLTPAERADLMAWLLTDTGNVSAGNGWKQVEVSKGDIDGMVRMYLEKTLATRADAADALSKGIANVQYMRPDADERILAMQHPPYSPLSKMTHEERKLFYLGRKTISRNGCFGCHDIPGFETAKPIGVPLNDWGKKDPERLAFDNIFKYIEEYHEDYDSFFVDALGSKRRDGFLHQKLYEPRSFDFEKFMERTWDDHLKMPQFKFARVARKPNESEADYRLRAARKEQEAREAVMTFILGLTAEPMPMKFVYQPSRDRMNEIKGLKLLEKYNCIGCHIVKPGSYEVAMDEETKSYVLRQFNNPTTQTDLKNDLGFPNSSAWRSPISQPPDRILLRGLPRSIDTEQEKISLELWEAFQFHDENGMVQQFPAGQMTINIPMKSDLPRHDPYGGLYADIHSRLLAKLERKNLVGDRSDLMGSVPPPLMREGQKVQPQWLRAFLLKPIGMRPAVYRYMKMPQFNMDEDEANQLVLYFASVDRIQEKALGIEEFTMRPEIQDPNNQEKLRQKYRQKLKQITNLTDEEIAKADYFETGWQMVVNRQLCLQCHNAGTFKAEGDLVAKAPAFYHAPDRLRPEYIARWVALPKRIIPFTRMPWFENFYNRGEAYVEMQRTVKKPGLKAVTQLTPLLSTLSARPMGAPIPMPILDQMYHRLQAEFALTPEEKLQAVRDAIMSWGYMTQPPPTGVKAGARPDAYQGDY